MVSAILPARVATATDPIASPPNTADHQDGGVPGTVPRLASHHNTASTIDGATLFAPLDQLLLRARKVIKKSTEKLAALEEIVKQIREQKQAGDTKARSPQPQGQDSDTNITSNIQTATSNEVSARRALPSRRVPRRVPPASDPLLSPNLPQSAAAASDKAIAPINDATKTQPAAVVATVEEDQQAGDSDGGAADTLQQRLSCGQAPSSSAPTPDDGSASSSEDGSTPATSPDSGCASNNTTTEGTEDESMTDNTTHASSNLHKQRDGVGMSTNVEAQVSTNAVATTGDEAIEPARTADDTPTTPDPLSSGSDLNRPGDKDLSSGDADEHRGRAHEPSDEQSNPGAASSGDATIIMSSSNGNHSAAAATGLPGLRPSKRKPADPAGDSPAKKPKGGDSGNGSKRKKKKPKAKPKILDHTPETMAKLAKAKPPKPVPQICDETTEEQHLSEEEVNEMCGEASRKLEADMLGHWLPHSSLGDPVEHWTETMCGFWAGRAYLMFIVATESITQATYTRDQLEVTLRNIAYWIGVLCALIPNKGRLQAQAIRDRWLDKARLDTAVPQEGGADMSHRLEDDDARPATKKHDPMLDPVAELASQVKLTLEFLESTEQDASIIGLKTLIASISLCGDFKSIENRLRDDDEYKNVCLKEAGYRRGETVTNGNLALKILKRIEITTVHTPEPRDGFKGRRHGSAGYRDDRRVEDALGRGAVALALSSKLGCWVTLHIPFYEKFPHSSKARLPPAIETFRTKVSKKASKKASKKGSKKASEKASEKKLQEDKGIAILLYLIAEFEIDYAYFFQAIDGDWAQEQWEDVYNEVKADFESNAAIARL
ncbi:LOW QUALITY PROTEIN: uncharacterized protein B0I36DRAFT_334903 [Microdochium trichocladiopsis]|uniref:Uncharacterized protein n=1 Tax=Microdochium trichocladiopsis TaxID=1682393 RepID=A0A9P8XZY0_9PEZI|nr:LOW QUALITY PROTEIN: uncharacterized protein B0I36DRAFT_334903 [Microdochium trichocladiopsis]KAH7021624.1 LOW QUALITY PROTEIN: hypothetical protein B0I36DRAFT_334903 [Microdochium trichocladiopsis]